MIGILFFDAQSIAEWIAPDSHEILGMNNTETWIQLPGDCHAKLICNFLFILIFDCSGKFMNTGFSGKFIDGKVRSLVLVPRIKIMVRGKIMETAKNAFRFTSRF